MQRVAQQTWPQAGVEAYVYGSRSTSLSIPESDVDVVRGEQMLLHH